MPASRRQVAAPETLAAFGATPLYTTNNDDDVTAGNNDSSIIVGGIQIANWKIRTQNSSIGNEQGMDELTVLLEETANDVEIKEVQSTTGEEEEEVVETATATTVQRQRRLCPPEITFLDAFISLEYYHEDIDDDQQQSECTTDNNDNIASSEIRFTATDALTEWAEAHKSLEMEPPPIITDEQYYTDSGEVSSSRGVSILRTLDAKVWSNKSRIGGDNSSDDSAPHPAHSSEFYYDWTFSSPYAGSILSKQNVSDNKNTSQPILLYDDIHLFEDDLHDNGESSLNIKIRIMPRCWYVLQRLFVRVDYVCVKCREVRYFCLLDNDSSTAAAADGSCKVNVVYRDVTWREASWTELNKRNLPVDPSAWMEHTTGSARSGVGGLSSPTGALPFAALLTKLPVVSTPDDLPKHSFFSC
ncbi:hypothetical protein ACHAWC_008726 [Mediolabrus comicus]